MKINKDFKIKIKISKEDLFNKETYKEFLKALEEINNNNVKKIFISLEVKKENGKSLLSFLKEYIPKKYNFVIYENYIKELYYLFDCSITLSNNMAILQMNILNDSEIISYEIDEEHFSITLVNSDFSTNTNYLNIGKDKFGKITKGGEIFNFVCKSEIPFDHKLKILKLVFNLTEEKALGYILKKD